MRNTRFYHVARQLFSSLGMPDITLAEGHAYTVVVDRRVEIRVVASGDDYLGFVAECGPQLANLDAGQLMALLNCNFSMRLPSSARVGVCPERRVAMVHGFAGLDCDDPGRVRAAFDDVVALADRVLAILADPRDGKQDRFDEPVLPGIVLDWI